MLARFIRLRRCLLLPLLTGALVAQAAPRAQPAAAVQPPAAASAALAAPTLTEPRFEAVGDVASITDGVVSALAQDGRGFIWIGTTAGLVRFDGYQLRTYQLGNDSKRNTPAGTSFVRSLLASQEGVLWIGTESDGLARFDPQTDRWTFFRSKPDDPKALAPGTVRALAQALDGTLWVGTIGGGLDRFDPATGQFTHFRQGAASGLPDDRIQTLFIDTRGDLWVGTWNGVARLRKGAERFETLSVEGRPLGERIITLLAESPDGHLWVGTQQGDLLRLGKASPQLQWIELGEQSGRRDTLYAMVAPDPQRLWVARASGIEERDPLSGRLLRRLQHDIRRPWGLAGNDVRALLRDAAGWIWVGSYGGGLQLHNPANAGLWVRHADLDEHSPLAQADVRSILQLRSGAVWMGTNERGVAILDRDLRLVGHIAPQEGAGFRGGRVGGLAQTPDGQVWVGTDTALYRFNEARQLLGHYSAGKGRVRRLVADGAGRLWVATQDGLYHYDREQDRLQRVTLTGGRKLSGDVNALAEDAEGRLWVGGEGGLYLLAKGASELEELRSPADAGLSNHSVLGLLIDRQQRLWVDTAAGLHRLNGWKDREALFERVSEKQGLGGKAFGANLMDDEQGRIWTHRAVFDPKSGRHHELSVADGAAFGTGWFRAYARLDDGRMLVGGSKGVLVIDAGRFKPWTYQPPLVVSEMRVAGERTPPGPVGETIVLKPGQRDFSLEFSALDFSNPAVLNYRYRLQGYDKDWIDSEASQRMASYTNLDPGRYLLQVQGSNRVGQWSPHELLVPLHVQPAWWQTWWARLGGVLLALLGVYGIVHLRTGYLRRAQAVLEARVRERTHELVSLSQALKEASLTDPLTGLRNRRFLAQHIESDINSVVRGYEGEVQRLAREPGQDIVFFMVDLDHFKQVNDDYGHAAGDAVLAQMQALLRQVFRDADYLIRWGGEEFLVVARNTDRHHAAELAERARRTLARYEFRLDDGRLLRRTCSLGFAAFPLSPKFPRGLDWSTVVDLADAALYAVKRGGRNGWLGLVSANVDTLEELREWSRRPLAEWAATGRLEMVGSGQSRPGLPEEPGPGAADA